VGHSDFTYESHCFESIMPTSTIVLPHDLKAFSNSGIEDVGQMLGSRKEG